MNVNITLTFKVEIQNLVTHFSWRIRLNSSTDDEVMDQQDLNVTHCHLSHIYIPYMRQ